MSFIVDTNIFIEILFEQKEGSKCELFLNNHIEEMSISDFSLHSIGVICLRNKKGELFGKFCADVLPNIPILSLSRDVYSEIPSFSKKMNLDFDDTYQALIAKEFDLRIATLDSDFKKVSKFIKVEFLK